ncbi:MAG: DoxX family protein, partial [Sphingomonadaceae bacterium]
MSGDWDAPSRRHPLPAPGFELSIRYRWRVDKPGSEQIGLARSMNRASLCITLSTNERLVMKTLNNYTSALPVIGRLMMAVLFVASAAGKLMAPGATIGYIALLGLPFATLGLVIAVAVELCGGLMLVFGIRTPAVALGLALFTLVTGLAFHHEIGNPMQLTQLLKNIAIAGGLLQIA